MSEETTTTTPGEHWYAALIQVFTATQDRNATNHKAAAEIWRMGADLCARMADVHAELARSVPDGDQAAADLGTAGGNHEVAGLKATQRMALDVVREQGVAQGDLAAALLRLEGRVDLLTGIVGKIAAKMGVDL